MEVVVSRLRVHSPRRKNDAVSVSFQRFFSPRRCDVNILATCLGHHQRCGVFWKAQDDRSIRCWNLAVDFVRRRAWTVCRDRGMTTKDAFLFPFLGLSRSDPAATERDSGESQRSPPANKSGYEVRETCGKP